MTKAILYLLSIMLALVLTACDDGPGSFPLAPRSNCKGTCIKMLGPASAPIPPDRVATHGALDNPECDYVQVALIETKPRFKTMEELWRFFQVEAAKLGADGIDLRHAGNDYKGGLYAGKALAFRCVKKGAAGVK